MPSVAVVALGGNAIIKPGERGDIHSQFAHTRESLASIVDLIRAGFRLVITHGNGPQAGYELIKNERARDEVPELPLGCIDAATEGWMGYMIGQSLQNRLRKEGIDRDVLAVITQVIVDKDDPAFANPTKPVGPFYSEEDLPKLRARGWVMKKDCNRGYRRVVPSPYPKKVVEANIIKSLVERDVIVIAVGGGGIPVYVEDDGTLEGVDAVIDKDRASSVLASEISAKLLIILTAVPFVYLNYDSGDPTPLKNVRLSEIRRFYEEGHFAPGSMAPKIEAAIDFLEKGGEKVIISSVESAASAVRGETGTHIIP